MSWHVAVFCYWRLKYCPHKGVSADWRLKILNVILLVLTRRIRLEKACCKSTTLKKWYCSLFWMTECLQNSVISIKMNEGISNRFSNIIHIDSSCIESLGFHYSTDFPTNAKGNTLDLHIRHHFFLSFTAGLSLLMTKPSNLLAKQNAKMMNFQPSPVSQLWTSFFLLKNFSQSIWQDTYKILK